MGKAGGEKSPTPASDDEAVICSICLDAVTNSRERSTAKLECGHEFHLDCIGSAFNIKGAMQCPNCRNVGKGCWLYGSGPTCSVPEFSVEQHLPPDEDSHQLTYSEMPIRIQWCPFSGVGRAHTSFWAVEPSYSIYYNFQRSNALFAQHMAASSVAPYVAYARPIPPISSNTNESVEDLNFNHPWNGISGQNDIFPVHLFPVTDIQQQTWGNHSHPFPVNSRHVNRTEQALVPLATVGSTRDEYDAMTRSRTVQPFSFGQGNSRAHERGQPSRAIHQQQQSSNSLGIPSASGGGFGRNSGPRVFPAAVPAISQSGPNGGFYIFPAPVPPVQNPHEAETLFLNRLQEWERYQAYIAAIASGRYAGSVPFSFGSGGSDASNRSANLGHRQQP